MNVGLVVPGFSAHPADWCIPALRDHARCLAERADVRVLALRYPHRAGRYRIDGAEVVALGGATRRAVGSLSLWQHALGVLRREHRARRFDVLHAFWATESGLLAAMAGRLLRVPTLVSLAGGELVALPAFGYGDQRRAWERLKVRASLRLASAVSAGSVLLHRTARAFVPEPERLYRLPLGVDLDRFSPAARVHDVSPARRIVHVASLTPVKDHATAFAALEHLARTHPGSTLELVGDGPLHASLVMLAERAGLTPAIRFSGAVEHDQLPARYRAADVCLVSSVHEAQSMVALEAAACGVPVVGTAVGVLPEITRDVVTPGDAAGLGRALLAPSRPEPEAIAHEFGLQRCVGRFLDVYQAI